VGVSRVWIHLKEGSSDHSEEDRVTLIAFLVAVAVTSGVWFLLLIYFVKEAYEMGLNDRLDLRKEVFTESYRDRHWRKCRYGTDPRTCNSAVLKNVICQLVTKPETVMLPNQPYTSLDNPYLAFCERDLNPCDARWEE